jgi:hypothetical protein
MPPAGFEPTIPASGRPQTHALDCAATGIGSGDFTQGKNGRGVKLIPSHVQIENARNYTSNPQRIPGVVIN